MASLCFDHECQVCPSQADEQFCDDCLSSLARERLALAIEEFCESAYVELWTKDKVKQYSLWRKDPYGGDSMYLYAVWAFGEWKLWKGNRESRWEAMPNSCNIYKVNPKNKYKIFSIGIIKPDPLPELQRSLLKKILPQE